MKKDWTLVFDNHNQPDYTTPWSVVFSALQEGGTNYVSVLLQDNLLQFSTYYDVFVVLQDKTKPTIDNKMSAGSDTNWYKTSPGPVYNVDFYDTPMTGSKISKIQTKLMRSALVSGATVQDWGDTVLSINATYYTDNWQVFFSTLWEGRNYVSVRAYDSAGNYDTSPDVFFVQKDTTNPTINNQQVGDDTWRSVNNGFYKTYFNDTITGSGVKQVDVLVSTTSSGIPVLVDWTTTVTTNTYAYTADWQLTQPVFDAMITGTTNYVWVRVLDFADNITTVTPSYAFYVKKDTSSIQITNNELAEGVTVWWNQTRTYNVDFYSGGIVVLLGAEYSVYTGQNLSGDPRVSWTPVPGFSAGTTYYTTNWPVDQFDSLKDGATNWVSVRVWNIAGTTVTSNDVFFIRKDTTSPSVPNLSVPLTGSATNQLTINFDWTDSTDLASGTTLYYIQISTVVDFTVLSYSSYVVRSNVRSGVLAQDVYYWKTRVKDLAGNWSVDSGTWSVIVDTTPAGMPPLAGPVHSSVTNHTDITFGWSAVTDAGPAGMNSYELVISTKPSFNVVTVSSVTAGLSVTTVLSENVYYWKVRSKDNAVNYSQYAATYTLTVDTTSPAVPVPSSPLTGTTTNQVDITFTWPSVTDSGPAGMNSYEIQVSTDDVFSVVSYSSSTLSAICSLPSVISDKYYWRVRSKDNAANYSAYSSTYMIVIDTSPPGTAGLVTPADGYVTNQASITFSWSVVSDTGYAGIDNYELQVSTDNVFSVMNYSSITVVSAAQLSTLNSQLYYWRVRVKDRAANYSVYSATRSVLVDTYPPVMIDNQAGDDTWYSSVPGNIFNIDFYDTPVYRGSKLGKAEYIIYTSTTVVGGAAGTAETGWITITDLAGSATYYEPGWGIDPATFTSLQQGYNFIFTRVYDMAGSSAVSAAYMFYIKKDTGIPAVTNNEPVLPEWESAGRPYNVDFIDGGIGVRIGSYTAFTGSNMAGQQKIPWTVIFTSNNIADYSDNWPLQFDLLSPGTNYVSVRCWDGLTNFVSSTDTFRIWKDTVPPNGITDLVVQTGLTDSGSLNLQWTSPADDLITDPGNIKLKSYLVKYKTSNFLSLSDFLATGTTYYQSWQMLNPSLTQSQALTGLTEGVTYYVGIVPVDKANNYSINISTSFSWTKRISPNRITCLIATADETLNPGEIKLNWVAVGDDYSTNTATGYLIKYSLTPIVNDTDFIKSTTYQQGWSPVIAGEGEEKVLINFTPGTTYYLAIKAYDDAQPYPNYSVMSNTVTILSRQSGPADGVLVYGNSTSAILKYWRMTSAGSSWSGPYDANSAAGTVRWTITKPCPTLRNEKQAVTLGSGGGLYVQRWDGQDLEWDTPVQLAAITAADTVYRPFDVNYEQTSGRCMVVYRSGSVGQVLYRVWSSTSQQWLVNETPLNVGAAGLIRWVRLEPRAGTDELMLVSLDANNKLYAYRWTGSVWTSSTSLTTGANTAYTSAYQCYDAAWELTRGNCHIVWGQGTTAKYAVWSSTSNQWIVIDSAGPVLSGIATGINWIKLASDRVSGSNRIAMTLLSADNAGAIDWNVSVWDGTSWANATSLSANMDEKTTRLTDVAWERDTGRCIAVGILTAAPARYVSTATWVSGAGWSTAGIDNGYDLGNNVDLRWLQLVPDQNSNKMVLFGSNAASDGSVGLRSRNWTGSAWTGGTSHTGIGSVSLYEFYMLAVDKHDTITPTVTDNQSGDDTWRSVNNAVYNIDFYDSGGSKLSKVQTRVTDSIGGVGTVHKDWGDESTLVGLNTDSYETDWPLSDTTFNSMGQGINYVSLIVYDGVGKTYSYPDAFYVRKDTNPPVITNNMAGGVTTWYNIDPGNIFGLLFSDSLSKLTTGQYVVYRESSQQGASVVSPSSFFEIGNSPQPTFTNNWGLNTGHWDLLQQGTNYVSIRAFDVAGGTGTVIDAFRILKDTVPPNAVTDLTSAAGTSRGMIDLTWSSPGDDGPAGNNNRGVYMIKYASYPITNITEFNSAYTWLNSINPSNAGIRETVTVSGLTIETTWYFSVRTRDKVTVPPNTGYSWSDVSNSTYSLPQRGNVYINEVEPYLTAGQDWIELYNNTPNTVSLNGWTLVYNLGTVDTPGTDSVLWTGTAGDTINTGTVLLIENISLDGTQSYHVKLVDSTSRVIDRVQWPSGMPVTQSVARINDGNNDYLELDPTPTKGYRNSVTTGVIKINEIDYASAEEAVELYNSSAVPQTITGWTLRSSNKIVFTFTSYIGSNSYAAVCWTSIDNSAKTWADAFGISGLNNVTDMAVLENEFGQVIDRVTYQSGSSYVYYNYRSQLVSYISAASGGLVSPAVIARQPTEGKDTDVDSNNFTSFPSLKLGYSNNTGLLIQGNTVHYPVDNVSLPRRFNLDITLGENSYSGSNDSVWFIRTSGAADTKSPHVYRLADLGFDLSQATGQSAVITGLSALDLNNNPLVNGTTYRMLLNSDTGTGAAAQAVINNITYDSTVHYSSAVNITARYLNTDTKNPVIRLSVTNSSTDRRNRILFTRFSPRLTNAAGTGLSIEQAQGLFSKICLYADNLDYDTTGTYELGVDTIGIAEIDNLQLAVDGTGRQVINISTTNNPAGMIPSPATRVYYLVIELTPDATNTFSVSLTSADITVSDYVCKSAQSVAEFTEVITSTGIIITPIPPPSGTQPIITISSAQAEIVEIKYQLTGDNNAFASTSDGKLASISHTGNLNWTFDAGSKINSMETSDFAQGVPGKMYLGTESGTVYKINQTNGAVEWSIIPGGQVTNIFVFDTGKSSGVWVMTTSSQVYRYSFSGEQHTAWAESQQLLAVPQGYPSMDDYTAGVNAFWCGSESGKLFKINNTNGSILSEAPYTGTLTDLVLDSGLTDNTSNKHNVYFGSSDGIIRCRESGNVSATPQFWADYNTGAAIRSLPYLDMIYGQGAVGLYFGNDNGMFYKVDPTSGTVKWTYSTNGPVRCNSILYGTKVYFGSDDGFVYALDSETGALVTGFPVMVSAAVKTIAVDTMELWDADGNTNDIRLYVGTADGKMHTLKIN
jgi:hypothetical protein